MEMLGVGDDGWLRRWLDTLDIDGGGCLRRRVGMLRLGARLAWWAGTMDMVGTMGMVGMVDMVGMVGVVDMVGMDFSL